MRQGPRDWNPPGYWDEPSASVTTRSARAYATTMPKARSSNVIGLLAVALGLFATLLPLAHPDASPGFRGFAFTTAGLTAVMFAIRAAHLRREGRATSPPTALDRWNSRCNRNSPFYMEPRVLLRTECPTSDTQFDFADRTDSAIHEYCGWLCLTRSRFRRRGRYAKFRRTCTGGVSRTLP